MPIAPSDSDKTSRPVGSAAANKKVEGVYREYGKIKNFTFDIGGNWDDKNVCIFLSSYRDTIKEFHDYSKKNIEFWTKVAERGISSGGCRDCFSSSNYCMEIAERLKEFVLKYEKELQGSEVFNELKNDVSDLLPYFPPPEYDLIVNTRKNNKITGPLSGVDADNVELILKICSKYLSSFGRTGRKYASVFAKISKEVSGLFPNCPDVRPILEQLKRRYITTLNAEPDPEKRARIFPELTRNFLIFDFVEPRDIKMKNYVPIDNAKDLSESRLVMAIEPKQDLVIESKRELKAIESSITPSPQEETIEVDSWKDQSPAVTGLNFNISETPKTAEESSEELTTNSGKQLDGSDNNSGDTNDAAKAVVPVRRRGRPKGTSNSTCIAKRARMARDISPIMTRALRRSKGSSTDRDSETETNRLVASGSAGQAPCNPFVSLVRVPIEAQRSSTDSSKNGRYPRKYSPADSISRRKKRTGGEFISPSNGFRVSPVDRIRRSFSPGNRSDGSVGDGRVKRKSRGGKTSADNVFRPVFTRPGPSSSLSPTQTAEEASVVPLHMARSCHPSNYSAAYSAARFNHTNPRPIESRPPWSRSLVQRARTTNSNYAGSMETSVYRGDRDDCKDGSSDFNRELIIRLEDHERNKMAVIREMHTEMIHEMRRTNNILERYLGRSQLSVDSNE